MIQTNEFNILLFPKCCTHYIIGVCNKVREECGYDIDIIVNHIPSSHISSDKKNNPTAVVVRDVWDWYVSRYFFYENARINQNGAFHITDSRCNSIYNLMWEKYCGFGQTIEGFRNHLPFALEYFPLGVNYFEFIRDAKNIHFLKFEIIADELTSFFLNNSPTEYSPSFIRNVKNQPITNKTEIRFTTEECYTPKESEMVYRAEMKYIARFGQSYNQNR